MQNQMKLPKLNEAGDPGTVQKWLVAVGDIISEGTAVMEVETDKAVIELESSITGKVSLLLVQAGDSVEPGQPILEVE